MAGSFLLPVLGCKTEGNKQMQATSSATPRTNWAGNYRYRASSLYTPESPEQLRELVRELGAQKALGSRHCFNNIADSPVYQISMERLNKVVAINRETMEVTVEGGIRYGDLAPELEKEGLALHNLASLPHISVAGACATATHGSGVENGNLASAVTGLELVKPDGSQVGLRPGHPDFNGAVVHLGALGIVSKITLKVVDTYEVAQRVFLDLPLESAIENFDAIMSGGYSVSLFTDWMDGKISQVWVKKKAGELPSSEEMTYYGARAADRNVHPIISLPAQNCTPQMGEPGSWHERLPHFKMGFTPSSGDELQSEFFVSRENAVDALMALEGKGREINTQLLISEIRSVAADELWLSPACNQDVIAFHFTWKPNGPEVSNLIGMIENELGPYSAVPHWGKLFSLEPAKLQERYPQMEEFRQLALRFDPEGKFRNAYLDRNIYA